MCIRDRWWSSRITVKPITRVVENARRLKEQDYSVTFGGSEFREIAELNEVLNETRYTLEQLDKMRSEIFSKAVSYTHLVCPAAQMWDGSLFRRLQINSKKN